MTLRLPNAPRTGYSADDQAQLRRDIEAFSRKPLASYSEGGGAAGKSVTIDSDLLTVNGSIKGGSFYSTTLFIKNDAVDNYSGLFMRAALNNFQLRSNDNGNDVQEDATKPSWAITIGEGAADNFAVYRRPPGGSYVGTWKIASTGHLVGFTDNSFDIGQSGANRPRNVYLGSSITTPLAFIEAVEPLMWWKVTTGGADEKYWRMYAFGAQWQMQLLNDANSASTNIVIVTRTGMTVTGWNFNCPVAFLADNAFDIGVIASQRARSIHLGTSVTVNGQTRINTVHPTYAAATTTVNRTALNNASTLATTVQVLGTLVNDLRSIGILA